VDINSLHGIEGVTEIGMNDIARITLRSAQPLFYDSYGKNRQTGALILIDPNTNETVGAAMVI
jgi:sulfate adenylyltransferase subunit 1